MDNIAGTKSGLTWAVHISVVLLVLLWLFPDRRALRVVLPHGGPDLVLGLVGLAVRRRTASGPHRRKPKRPCRTAASS
jgi:putative copper export protein